MHPQSAYSFSFTAASLRPELVGMIADYFFRLGSWDDTKRFAHLDHVHAGSTNAREKTAARKEADKLRKARKECQEWEREVVLPLAQRRIELDLDDGVKANYLKFPGLLAKIPGLVKKEED